MKRWRHSIAIVETRCIASLQVIDLRIWSALIDGVALNERKLEMNSGKMVKLFSDQMNEVIDELHEALAA